jgi:hypothetical protein
MLKENYEGCGVIAGGGKVGQGEELEGQTKRLSNRARSLHRGIWSMFLYDYISRR